MVSKQSRPSKLRLPVTETYLNQDEQKPTDVIRGSPTDAERKGNDECCKASKNHNGVHAKGSKKGEQQDEVENGIDDFLGPGVHFPFVCDAGPQFTHFLVLYINGLDELDERDISLPAGSKNRHQLLCQLHIQAANVVHCNNGQGMKLES
ncbi:MAG: hypothetical protein SGARI_003641, partial [Bacillariaceae sp.]